MWGWGAVCQRVTTGGPWSLMETSYHINYLELLAAFLAVQCFTKNHPHPLTIYFHIDNTTAIAYLNHKGGTSSPPLCNLSGHVSEHHTSGQSHTRLPEHNSRQRISNSTGQMGLVITPQYLPEDQEEMGTTISGSACIQVDTSTTSWRQDPYATATDSFLQIWSGKICYANPPVGPHAQDSLGNQPATHRCDNSSTSLESNTTLPVVRLPTPSSPTATPTSFPILTTTSFPTTGSATSRMAYLKGYCQTENFLKQLQCCSWSCGEKNPTNLTTYSFTSGNAAGVDTGGVKGES